MDNMNYILSRIICENTFTPVIPLVYIQSLKPGHRFGPHSHESIEVISILSGTCYMVIKNEHIKLRKNECLVIFPNVDHMHYLDNNSSCRMINIHFTPGEISNYFDIHDLQNNLCFFYEIKTHARNYLRLMDNSFIRFISEQIYLEWKDGNKGKYSETLLKLHFCELYVYLSKIINETYEMLKKPLNKHIARALEYIGNNYGNKITISEIADYVKISPRQLTRLFYEELNITIQTYITDLRIEKAKELLKDTSLRITDIAFIVGFNSSEYFATCFRKTQAISPMEYRLINTGNVPISNDSL